MSRPRIAFVIQRYGEQISGGSESACREIAERLTSWYDIEVLTTCALDHRTWRNELQPGNDTLNRVCIRRFPVVQERQHQRFQEMYDRIFGVRYSEAQEMEMIRLQGPYCPSLILHLERHAQHYAAFVFFTYLYYPAVAGLPLVGEKSIFIPTAHDEPGLYLGIFDRVFRSARRHLFLSPEEQYLTERRFVLPSGAGRFLGFGIDEPASGEDDGSYEPIRASLEGRRVLTYVGRVEAAKGCAELIEYFLRFRREESAEDLTLLLLGRRAMNISNPGRHLLAAGFVSDHTKYECLRRTTVAVAPSPYESLCIAALESWMHEKPLLANGACPVLVGHCQRSNGGLWYTSYGEFRECLRLLLSDPSFAIALGRQGHRYVSDTYRWDRVIAVMREELDGIIAAAP
ncbi:MAG: glycosyltransferase family 4 protein [Bryobacteraceae bacterium]|nr:glycosyltransferase family 4 protein [Bryobacteraceae bacterium]